MVDILSRINRYIKSKLSGLGKDNSFDPNKFENDLIYFREWFRMREESLRDKYDFFYGPLSDDEEAIVKINHQRLKRMRAKKSKERGSESRSNNITPTASAVNITDPVVSCEGTKRDSS